MKKIMSASLLMSLMFFANAYSQNSNNNSANRYSYWQYANQTAQNNESEPTTIYPTERGSSSGITTAAREDRLYQSRGYPITPAQAQNTNGQQAQNYQNTYNPYQYDQSNAYQYQGGNGQDNQAYYNQNMQAQEAQQFNNNSQQNYGYMFR